MASNDFHHSDGLTEAMSPNMQTPSNLITIFRRSSSNLLDKTITFNWIKENVARTDQNERNSLETYFDEPFRSGLLWFLSWKCSKGVRSCRHKATSIFDEAIQRREIDGETFDG